MARVKVVTFKESNEFFRGLSQDFRTFQKRTSSSFNKPEVKNIIQKTWIKTYRQELLSAINDTLNRKNPLHPAAINFVGEKKFVLERNKSGFSISYSDKDRVGFGRFRQRRVKRLQRKARPYNIHWGAAGKHTRYAILSVQILGKNYKAGKKGSHFQGLGFEPVNVPKSSKPSATWDDYNVFIRKLYPGRAKPDKLLIHTEPRLSYPIYVEFLNDSKYSRPFFDKIERETTLKRKKGIIELMVKEFELAFDHIGENTYYG